MIFKNVKGALTLYVEWKLKGVDEVPSIFSSIDKYRVNNSCQWMCNDCYSITDVHTGECEQCGGHLVSYKNTWAHSSFKDKEISDKLDRIDFIVDFEKMLKTLTIEEKKLMLYFGYSDMSTVIKYILTESDIRNTCENVDHAVKLIKNAEKKLEDEMIRKEYIKINESANSDGSGSNREASPKRLIKAAQRFRC